MSTPTPALLPRNTAFSMDLPTLQFAWDSTSMGALKRCPRYYQYAIIEGWAPRAESVHLVFGLHYHSALEFYYRQQVEGVDHESAVRAVVRRALEATWDRKLSRPWFSDHKQKNRETLLRSIVWYLDQFKHDPMTTVTLANGKPAVELTFKFTTSYTAMTGEPILWCGHLDRLVSYNDDFFTMDHKTTTSAVDERFFQKFSPDNQFSGYIYAGKVIYNTPLKGIVVNGVQIGVNFSRFQRQIVMRHDAVLDEWYGGLGTFFKQAEDYALANYWPMNEMSCGNYGGCAFRDVCSKPPSIRPTWLKADFTRRVWDPLVAREGV